MSSSNHLNEPPVIHIIDDEESVRHSCAFLISSLGLSTQTWDGALRFLQQVDIYAPAVVISDLMMPDMSGQALQIHLNKQQSPIALIALTGNGEIADAVAMLKKGAVDYLEKPIGSQRLQEAIQHAQALTLKRAKLYYIRTLYAQLTEKEKQVANELMQGNLNKNIADHLDVSMRTIEVHRSQVMKKMQAQHVSELIQKLVLLDS
ncbi:probable transcriiptional regulatory protein, LuxR family [Psychrobacter arcticus 273-4]|uniref:Probable transcriiptional regulatory protein, LuxR family n=1 Tax=Psychrobacter arcticus (strain DSM 17307 / VKM B-2377 / 273-4) TaxID=259536 RepID=Q4FRS2_PSYA2|nr:response regulator [Psychrobacter arcticus]AAZ19286.1 probable transcriiptional regulatory protein, LuxR family [Psychrobacter arcticus 273-4]